MSAAERVVIVGAGAAGLDCRSALQPRSGRARPRPGRSDRRYLVTPVRASPSPHDSAILRARPLPDTAQLSALPLEGRVRVLPRRVCGAVSPPRVARRKRGLSSPARAANLQWEIETSRRTLGSEVVVVATGHYAEPRVPSWPGIDEFQGRLLHSSEYRTGREFEGCGRSWSASETAARR